MRLDRLLEKRIEGDAFRSGVSSEYDTLARHRFEWEFFVYLRFVNYRAPKSVEEMSALEQAQLVAAGKAWDGEALSAEARLREGDEGRSFLGFLHIWDVIDEADGNRVVFTYFSYMVDSGAFFNAGTTEYDADVIQDYLHNPRTKGLGRALADAGHRQWDELGYARFRVNDEMLD